MRIRVGLCCLVLCVSLGAACGDQAASSEKWLEDFELLKAEMATGYANLEWSTRDKQLDLAALSRDTEEQLRRTRSARKARKILTRFLESFGDPHLRAEHQDEPPAPSRMGSEWHGPAATASTGEALEALGYRKSGSNFDIDFDALDGFRELPDDDNPFPAAVLTLPNQQRLGLLRIEYFGEDRYYKTAEAVWPQVRDGIDDVCRSDCWWEFTREVRHRLMSALRQRIEQLESAGAQALVVDITRNGGGSEWCEDVAQLFHPTPLRAPGVGLVRHPHWAPRIEREVEGLQADLQRQDLTPTVRRMLETTLQEHQQLLTQVHEACDPSCVWAATQCEPCSSVVAAHYGRFTVPEGGEAWADSLQSASLLFRRPRDPQFTGVYTGRVFVLIDPGTASASEQFATLLQFNEAATLVGETTYGAGCGYTNGGIRLYLPHTQLRVWMPDCMRFRADGENERAGVEPDVVGWEPGSKGKSQARALQDTLVRLMAP